MMFLKCVLMIVMTTAVIAMDVVAGSSTFAATKRQLRPRKVSSTASLKAEIMKLRSTVQTAIERGDAATLRRLYADDFTHTHAIGKVDSKKQRLVLNRRINWFCRHFGEADLPMLFSWDELCRSASRTPAFSFR